MKKYDKLIRDRIPEIIKESGKKCIVEKIDDQNIPKYLDKKLKEEVEEYFESGEIEEIADILEVLREIIKYKNISFEKIQKIREDKKTIKGGFSEKLKLKRVID